MGERRGMISMGLSMFFSSVDMDDLVVSGRIERRQDSSGHSSASSPGDMYMSE